MYMRIELHLPGFLFPNTYIFNHARYFVHTQYIKQNGKMESDAIVCG